MPLPKSAAFGRTHNNNGRSFELEPPLPREQTTVAFTDFRTEGLCLLSSMPKRWPKNDPSYCGHLLVPGRIISDHIWIETDKLGTRMRKSVVYLVRFLRVHTRSGSLVMDTATRRLPTPVGKHEHKYRAYVKRINKKWAKRNLIVYGPKMSEVNIRIGAATLSRIYRTVTEEDVGVQLLSIPPARRTDLPFSFAREIYKRPFNK